MKNGHFLLAACLAFTSSLSPVMAQTPSAISIGPDGGYVSKVVFDPSVDDTLYAASRNGVFKSTDRGATWSRAGAEFEGTRIHSLTITRADQGALYISSELGAHRSTDGGTSWQRVFENLPFHFVEAIYPHPVDASLIFVQGALNLHRTTDGGATWEVVEGDTTTFRRLRGFDLAFAPSDPSTLYTNGTGVFVSRDSGQTWDLTAFGFGSIQLAVDAVDPDVVYTIKDASALEGYLLFSSTDGGETWRQAPLGGVTTLAAHPTRSGTVYAGRGQQIFRSTDHGVTWEALAESFDVLADVAVDDQGILWSGGLCGVYRFDQGGSGQEGAWDSHSRGLTGTEVRDIEVSPVNPGTLYAATVYCGPWKSLDSGLTWQRLPFEWGFNLLSFDIEADPASPRIVYNNTPAAVFRSEDGGQTWVRKASIESQGFAQYQGGVEIAPSDPTLVYVVRQEGVYRSNNQGRSFFRVNNFGLGFFHTRLIAIDPKDARTVYAWSNRLAKTTNDGASWRAIGRGLPQGSMQLLEVDPRDRDVLYAVHSLDRDSRRVVFKSVDGGERFTRAHTGLSGAFVESLLIDPELPDTVYVGTHERGIYRSRDGGTSWLPLEEVTTRAPVWALAANRSGLYAGLQGAAVRYTKSCGDLSPVGEAFEHGVGSAPDVAVDGRGRAFVSWADAEGLATGQMMNPNGFPLRQPFRIGGKRDVTPIVAADGPGETLVIFRRDIAVGNAIWVRAYLMDSRPTGIPARLDTEPSRFKTWTDVARARSGNAVAVWDSMAADGRTLIRGRRLGRAGAVLGPAFTVRGGVDRLLAPAVGLGATGRFAVAWLEAEAGGLLVVRQQFHEAGGEPRGDVITLSSPGAVVSERQPVVVVHSSGEVVTAWFERDSDNTSVVVRRVDADGQPIAEQRWPIAEGGGLDLAVDEAGRALLVRTVVGVSGSGGGAGGPKVHATLLSPTGDPIKDLVVGPGSAPAVAFDQDGVARVAWRRGGRIHSQRLRLDCLGSP